ncbi:MAG: ROK family protein, partial [Candidatus Omnitrophica bacterium]|nr:ROK family protein [Candidatus Omnitrophota bacterium]
VLGIGFRGGECFLTVMDIGGNIVAKENIRIGLLLRGRGKNKDITGIVRKIADRTGLRNNDFACAGVAVPEEVIAGNPRSMDIFARGIGDIFECEVFLTTSATGAGYGDREFTAASRGKDVLYMYSDVGIGVILKKELIFEADEYDVEQNGAYLRPWNQLSIVRTTKDLVSRGVGTDIVRMIKGDVDAITLDVVLKAAENKDELAEDLIKRSGLALGVRVAYLVNMFRVGFVLFGGGIEKEEVRFIQYVKESLDRFLSGDILSKLEIIPGVLGKESSSVGAALLCRREIFMGV